MSLLNQIMDRPLDAGYQEAAASKNGPGGQPLELPGSSGGPRRRSTWLVLMAAAAVIGLSLTWGVRVLRSPDPQSTRARGLLEAETQQAVEEVDRLEQTNRMLSGTRDQLRFEVLAASDPTAAAKAEQLAATSGAMAVAGPGLRVQLSTSRAMTATSERIQASDLRLLAGALWQSGAEAVTVNQIRLTSLTAVRDVGESIQVQLRPISEPYVIEAIGPADQLEVGLAKAAGARISLLRDYLGATVSVEAVKQIEMPPGLAMGTLLFAQPAAEEEAK